ncbi:MAG: DNA/RNA non-specific endonuclease, partial [Bacteroidaceae bacterium]|nr:DNA/RNA non-specific endonuclease [Bacteroidaceae bacterium]
LRSEYNTAKFRDTLYVVKGGTIRDDQLLEVKKGLPVPKYFFMALLCKNKQTSQGGYKAVGFWIEHNTTSKGNNFSQYAMSIDALEERTGIDFFCNLPDDIENKVESNYVPAVWGF